MGIFGMSQEERLEWTLSEKDREIRELRDERDTAVEAILKARGILDRYDQFLGARNFHDRMVDELRAVVGP